MKPDPIPTEVTFDAYEAEEGGYYAAAREFDIVTEGDDWEELKRMVRDATLCHFDEGHAPQTIRLRSLASNYLGITQAQLRRELFRR